QWHNTESDEDTRAFSAEFWNRHRRDIESGQFWADRIKPLRGEPDKRWRSQLIAYRYQARSGSLQLQHDTHPRSPKAANNWGQTTVSRVKSRDLSPIFHKARTHLTHPDL